MTLKEYGKSYWANPISKTCLIGLGAAIAVEGLEKVTGINIPHNEIATMCSFAGASLSSNLVSKTYDIYNRTQKALSKEKNSAIEKFTPKGPCAKAGYKLALKEHIKAQHQIDPLMQYHS
jgi:hypothetical protein